MDKWIDFSNSKAHPDMVKFLDGLLRDGSDFDCYKINPFRIAEIVKVSRIDSVKAFLIATKLGIFDLTWDIYCPSCTGLPEYHNHLMGLKHKAHCQLCEIDWELDFAEQVEVSFTVNPAIRKLHYADFKERDFNGMMDYLAETQSREDRTLTIGGCIFPDKAHTFSSLFTPGVYKVWVPGHLENSGRIYVAKTADTESEIIDFSINENGLVNPKEIHINPGTVKVRVSSSYPYMNGFLVAPDKQVKNWVSAAWLTSQQDFRELFSSEYLSPEMSFAIRTVTLMFTDVKSSTAMYEKLGDSQAFELVKKHFAIMEDELRNYEGGVVKTIGDSVMASFPDNLNAVKCAIAIQRAIKKQAEPLSGLQVRIGLHRGYAIAVTSNRNLDFFGSTVNTAARVESKADAGEVVCSEDVLCDAEVSKWFEEQKISLRSFKAELKGLSKDFTLFCCTP